MAIVPGTLWYRSHSVEHTFEALSSWDSSHSVEHTFGALSSWDSSHYRHLQRPEYDMILRLMHLLLVRSHFLVIELTHFQCCIVHSILFAFLQIRSARISRATLACNTNNVWKL